MDRETLLKKVIGSQLPVENSDRSYTEVYGGYMPNRKIEVRYDVNPRDLEVPAISEPETF